jgi:hypothetical protein
MSTHEVYRNIMPRLYSAMAMACLLMLTAALQDEEHKRALLIVIGQRRGGPLAWKSLHQHVLRPYKPTRATVSPEKV